MPEVMPVGRGYREHGYKSVHVYVRPLLYLALVLRARSSGRMINEALEEYFRGCGHDS
ncbi:hypothetical protein [Vulcanisaeta souniana]|uniref:hypothetical protein n=1 Tax=Vulcanisaeta souniana TaxID=164452 RepID=UPI001FB5253B|nr:hypothetical protein [Vulcanisaeta souniana]